MSIMGWFKKQKSTIGETASGVIETAKKHIASLAAAYDKVAEAKGFITSGQLKKSIKEFGNDAKSKGKNAWEVLGKVTGLYKEENKDKIEETKSKAVTLGGKIKGFASKFFKPESTGEPSETDGNKPPTIEQSAREVILEIAKQKIKDKVKAESERLGGKVIALRLGAKVISVTDLFKAIVTNQEGFADSVVNGSRESTGFYHDLENAIGVLDPSEITPIDKTLEKLNKKQRRKDKKKEEADAKSENAEATLEEKVTKKKSMKDRMLGGLSNLKDRMGKRNKEVEDEKASVAASGKAKGKSWLGAILGGLFTLGSFLVGGYGKIVLGATKFLLGGMTKMLFKSSWWLVKNLTMGLGGMIKKAILFAATRAAAGTAAEGAVGVAAKSGLWAGLKAAAPMIGRGLAMLATGPVGWAIGAGTVLYGAYKLYKYLTRNSAGEVTRIRLFQYGLGEVQKDNFHLMFKLETLLKPLLIKKNYEYTLKKFDKETTKVIMEDIFNIASDKPEDKPRIEILRRWLNTKFTPTYLAHLNALETVRSGLGLEDIDKLTPAEVIRYVKLCSPSANIYNVDEIPIIGYTKITIQKFDVDKQIEKVIADNEKLVQVKPNVLGKVEPPKPPAKPDVKPEDKPEEKKEVTPPKIQEANKETVPEAPKSDKVAIVGVVKPSETVGGTKVNEAASGVKPAKIDIDEKAQTPIDFYTALGEAKAAIRAHNKETGIPITDEEYKILKGESAPNTERLKEIIKENTTAKTQNTNGVKPNKVLTPPKEGTKEYYDQMLAQPKTDSDKLLEDKLAAYKQNKDREKEEEALESRKLEQLNERKKNPQNNYTKDGQLVRYDPNKKVYFTGWGTPVNPKDIEWGDNDDNGNPRNKTTSGLKSSATVSETKPTKIAESSPPSDIRFDEDEPPPNTGDASQDKGMSNSASQAYNNKLKGIDPNMLRLFNAMSSEYQKLGGKMIPINEGFRTREDQEAMLRKYGPARAAKPGNSPHEFGLAIDIPSEIANDLERKGLMTKFGFTRPIGGEQWHLEPAGVSLDPNKAKKDLQYRADVINKSPGRGGGGYGAQPGTPMGKRNIPLQKSAYNNGSTQEVKSAGEPIPVTDNGNSGAPKVGSGNGMSYGGSSVGQTTDQGGLAGGLSGTNIGDGSKMSPKEAIAKASEMTGVSKDTLLRFGQLESSLNGGAANKASTAQGLFQFTGPTWKAMVAKYGPKYGIPEGASPSNSYYSSLMAAEYIKENLKILMPLGSKAGLSETVVAYLGHHFGATGGGKLINAYIADKTTPVDKVLSSQAMAANKSILYENGVAVTVGALIGKLTAKINGTKGDDGGNSLLSKANGATGDNGGVVGKPTTDKGAIEGDPEQAGSYGLNTSKGSQTSGGRLGTSVTSGQGRPSMVYQSPGSPSKQTTDQGGLFGGLEGGGMFGGIAKAANEAIKTASSSAAVATGAMNNMTTNMSGVPGGIGNMGNMPGGMGNPKVPISLSQESASTNPLASGQVDAIMNKQLDALNQIVAILNKIDMKIDPEALKGLMSGAGASSPTAPQQQAPQVSNTTTTRSRDSVSLNRVTA